MDANELQAIELILRCVTAKLVYIHQELQHDLRQLALLNAQIEALRNN